MAEPAYRALLIGNSTFPHDTSNLQDLEGPVNDIALLRDALTDPTTGLFDRHDVRLLPERTMSEVLIELERFFGTASRTDRLLLYYSGHGLLTATNQLLLAARDTRTDSLLATTVSATAINGMIEASAAMTTMIVLDCCYSGSFKGADLPRSLEGNGRYLLTSTRSGQLANDADRLNGTSQFTTHLIEGLLSGAPDRDGDGFVDLDDLYEFVHRRLTGIGRQIPQRNFAGGGDVMVARRPPRTTGPLGPGADDASTASRDGRAPAELPPVLDLSETVIDVRDIEHDEVLSPERVAVLNRGGGRLDWVATSDADWLSVTPDGDDVRIELRPRPGHNRGAVLVRDRGPGGAKAIRVHVHVRPEEPAPPPRPLSPLGSSGPDPVVRPWWRRRTTFVGCGVGALLLAVLAVVLVPRGEGGGGSGGEEGTATTADVLVDGAQFWTDTGLDVAAGDRVAVVADGEVFHRETASVGPEGFPNEPELLTPFPELNHAALIGRVGDEGPAFYVGRARTITAEGAGRLFLGINDGGLENNRGHFTTTVAVEPRVTG